MHLYLIDSELQRSRVSGGKYLAARQVFLYTSVVKENENCNRFQVKSGILHIPFISIQDVGGYIKAQISWKVSGLYYFPIHCL